MIGVIIGDIINSRKIKAKKWFPLLKKVLNTYGKESKDWEIFRGDSFQLETSVEDALKIALIIKANIKQIKNLDVRMAIGLGKKDFCTERTTHSSGEVFLYSEKCFRNLKKQTLLIKSHLEEFNHSINLALYFANFIFDNWTVNSAIVVKSCLENPSKTQNQLAQLINKKQNRISESLKRSHFKKLKKLLNFYHTEINKKILSI